MADRAPMTRLTFTCPRCWAPGGSPCVTSIGRATQTHKVRGAGVLVRVKADPADVGAFRGGEVYWPDNIDTVFVRDGRMFDGAGMELEVAA